MNKQRRLRKRTILTLIPMAMIVIGASPGRPLKIGGNSRYQAAHLRRTGSKIHHLVHSDNFSHNKAPPRGKSGESNGMRLQQGERIPHGPWLEHEINFHVSLYGGCGTGAASRPVTGIRQRTRMMKRGVMELAVRGIQFRNRFTWREHRSSDISHNSFVDMNRGASKMTGSSLAISCAGRSKKRMILRPFVNFFDRSSSTSKSTVETADAMHAMIEDMNEVDYNKAIPVLSPNHVDVSTNNAFIVSMSMQKKGKNKWNNLSRINNLFKSEKSSESHALSSRGGAIAATCSGSLTAASAQKLSIRTSTSSISQTSAIKSLDTWIIETPLFPIILPKSWEPPTTKDIMEISVSLEQETTLSKPSLSTLQIATQPLVPKSAWSNFQGNEFYYPETMDMLTQTGLHMTLESTQVVDWTAEKKTLKFLQDQSSQSLSQALASSNEVLVWSGKFNENGQGSELPVIKTMAVIDKSPEYLAELLMDSNKVKIYNKMSLGRNDEEVFQSGVNTMGGSFGDGESKIVRNLTKPPMVNNILEFITCMHARKLRSDDANLMSSNVGSSSGNETLEGYIVVSRAVTGGKWTLSNSNGSGEKYVRNEILLGVNLLKAIPGEPNKTELTAVTHVYSPMVPLMLAKSAGMKGAVDFVRDIRAIS